MAGWALIGIAGEAYFRLTVPFMITDGPFTFTPKVGKTWLPNAEIRHTNRLDFWTVSPINSLGFVDREPISPEHAAASCHIAMTGDSFVEAVQVPIADKFHVRLEELAARKLSHLNVTTSAFGLTNTGQINQLPFYDQFARRLRPDLLVLVFVPNDFMDNSPPLSALISGRDPDRDAYLTVAREPDGTFRHRPPDPGWWENTLPRLPPLPKSWLQALWADVTEESWAASWLDTKMSVMFPPDAERQDPQLIAWAEFLSRRPSYASLLDGWRPTTRGNIRPMFAKKNLPPVFEEALEFTAFALDQFKARAERDGVSLAILAVHLMGRGDNLPLFERMNAMAEARGIPVIDQHNYIVRQGGRLQDANFAHDFHWNATGHRWAAEALLESLKQNQEVCAARKAFEPVPSLRPYYLAAYESIAAGEPAARSDFDLYLGENTLTYLKSPCGAPDTQAPFFLHVVPEDVEDLPAHRRQYGFDNLDFHYDGYGSMPALVFGGRCMVERRLPEYPIASIRTGQYTPGEGQIWKAEFPVRAVRGEAAARSAPGRAPGR